MRVRRTSIMLVLLAAVAALFATAAPASAATITVTSSGGGAGTCPSASGCTLTTAVADAGAGDTIEIPASVGTITLSAPLEPVVSLTIAGAGAGTTKISGGGSSQMLEVDGVNVTVSGIEFEDGLAASSGQDPGSGGAIDNGLGGSLTVSGCAFLDNVAEGGSASGANAGYGALGGAIYSDGVLDVTSSSFSDNASDGGAASSSAGASGGEGGAIFSDQSGTLRVSASSFDGNEAQAGGSASGSAGNGGDGGAVALGASVGTVSTSTFGTTAANVAEASDSSGTAGGEGGEGGAVYESISDLTLSGDTLEDNTADGAAPSASDSGAASFGGAVASMSGGALTIVGGSFSGNEAEGGPAGGGAPASGGDGGAVFSQNVVLTIGGGASFAGNIAGGGAAGTSSGGNGGNAGAVAGEYVTLDSVTFSDNQADAGGDAGSTPGRPPQGGALAVGGSLEATDVAFDDNLLTTSTQSTAVAGAGGAVLFNGASIGSIAASSFSGNTIEVGGTIQGDGGTGGAVSDTSSSVLSLSGDDFTGNAAPNGYGGGLYVASGSASVSASTLSGNSASGGGAINADNNGQIGVSNSTIVDNTAESTPAGSGSGGGVRVVDTLRLASDTIVDNAAYGGGDGGNIAAASGSTLYMGDTLVADGRLLGTGSNVDANCAVSAGLVSFIDLGYNAEDDQGDGNECNLAAASGDLVDSTTLDGYLGALAGNGGSLQTVALLPGSPAIDAGDPDGCSDASGAPLASDERGVARPQGGRCDIGAYEYEAPSSTTPPSSPPPGATPVAPALSGLALDPHLFVTLPGAGTAIVYSDTQAALTSFKVSGSIAGYRKGRKGKGRCRRLHAGGRRPRHSTSCTITGTFASFSHQDSAGLNVVSFSGRPGGRALAPGHYTLSATPALGGLSGASVKATFTVVR
ncbi:MAG TPA: choice-of-anchor Q domain-containing protein [Solirubrobacteraceae bacterium]|nr:choice-of-anchor Q domain-containing protein [Solirubrobacteraceae bacterium]